MYIYSVNFCSHCTAQVMSLLDHMDAVTSDYRIDLLTHAFAEMKQKLIPQQDQEQQKQQSPPPQQQQQQQQQANGVKALPSEPSTAVFQDCTFFTEPWFKLEAGSAPLPEQLVRSWMEAERAHELTLPPQNPYIPSDFSLRNVQGGGEGGKDKQGSRDVVMSESAAAAEAEAEPVAAPLTRRRSLRTAAAAGGGGEGGGGEGGVSGGVKGGNSSSKGADGGGKKGGQPAKRKRGREDVAATSKGAAAAAAGAGAEDDGTDEGAGGPQQEQQQDTLIAPVPRMVIDKPGKVWDSSP